MAESGASTDSSAGRTRQFSLDINACDERFERVEYFQRDFFRTILSGF